MAIIRITNDTELKPGDIISPASPLIGGICAGPVIVKGTKGQRIYYRRAKDPDTEENLRFMMRKSAIFKCDTIAEAATLLEVSFAKRRDIDNTQKAIEAKYSGAVKALLDTGTIPEGVL